MAEIYGRAFHGFMETRLLRCVQQLFRNVRPEHSPHWLGRQRIDVAVPRHKLAFEYHGQQHYEVDGHWNLTEDDLRNQRELDRRKQRELKRRGWTLIEVPYWDHEKLSSSYLKDRLHEAGVWEKYERSQNVQKKHAATLDALKKILLEDGDDRD